MTQGTKFSQLPPALSLAGNELIAISVPQTGDTPVPFVSMSTTVEQIAYFATTGGETGLVCSMRQLVAALAGTGELTTLFQSLSSNITDEYNIAYFHAYRMSITDPFITGFLAPTLSYTQAEVENLFVLALTYPV